MIEASLSEPHIDEFAVNFLYIYMYIYLCRTLCCKSLLPLVLLASYVISKMTQATGMVHAVKARRTVTRMDGQRDRDNRMLDLRFLCWKSLGRSLLATAMGASACQIMRLECFHLPPCGVRWTSLYAACLLLDLTYSVYFLIFRGLRFSYILMTHATAPRSACTLAQAHPTMSCIPLVAYNC